MRRFSSGHLPQSRALKLCTALEGTTITAAIILFLRALRRLDFWMSPNHRSVFQGCRLHHPASVSDRRRLAERKERHSVLAQHQNHSGRLVRAVCHRQADRHRHRQLLDMASSSSTSMKLEASSLPLLASCSTLDYRT